MERKEPKREYRQHGKGLTPVDLEKVKRHITLQITDRPRTSISLLVHDLKDKFPNGKISEFHALIRLMIGAGDRKLGAGQKLQIKKGSVVTIYSVVCDCGKVHKILAERF